VVPFDERAAGVFDQLETKKIRIGRSDLPIAATCLDRSALLLSRNMQDFSKVPGLRVEDLTFH